MGGGAQDLKGLGTYNFPLRNVPLVCIGFSIKLFEILGSLYYPGNTIDIIDII